MKIYHVTTERKARLYRQTGGIRPPVRGFDTLPAAMAWAMRVGRKVIYEVDATRPLKLPDHHNAFGEAYWTDEFVRLDAMRCAYSAGTAIRDPEEAQP